MSFSATFIMPYRPLSSGRILTPEGKIEQLEDGRWTHTLYGKERDPAVDSTTSPWPRITIEKTIKRLNDYSSFKHKILVVIDSDVYPNKNFLKEFDNVVILKTNYVPGGRISEPYWRINTAYVDGINSIADEEWICYAYLSDLLCAKDWDKYIHDVIQSKKDRYVYVPMFVEIGNPAGGPPAPKGALTTANNIWVEWRNLGRYYLTMPEPDKGYVTEDDLNEYIRIANEANKGVIEESCGDRNYGFFAAMFVKAKYAKQAIALEGQNFDIFFDNRLKSVCGLNKLVVTNSFVFHPSVEYREKG